jgi:hypothetical protein
MNNATTHRLATALRAMRMGPVATAAFCCPNAALAALGGSIFVAEDHTIRKILPDGIVTTIAGSDEGGFVNRQRYYIVSIAQWAWPSQRAAHSSSVIFIQQLAEESGDLSNGRAYVDPDHSLLYARDVAKSSDGTLYVAAKDGLHEIRSSADGVIYVSRLAPEFLEGDSGLSCCLDEPNGLLYITNGQELFTTSVHTALEQRATRIPPLVTPWALTQRRRRVDIAPAAIAGVK